MLSVQVRAPNGSVASPATQPYLKQPTSQRNTLQILYIITHLIIDLKYVLLSSLSPTEDMNLIQPKSKELCIRVTMSIPSSQLSF